MQHDHKAIERKWQDFWSASKIYTTPDAEPGKENFYLLVEFPYPSGNLHVGHWYAFAVPDILARYQRMQGKNVLYPIGFDAFGLPAENAAIKNGINPADWTEKNIAFMKTQIQSMGASFDWSREVATCRPDYYKWTQWLFLELHKKGLVYRKETAVNWCPNDKTVLANEQVIDGKCDRCGSEVEQRQMLQWNIKITDYADRLIDDLDGLDWPEQIKEAQRNWIGRSEGAEIDFGLSFGEKRKYVILHGFEGSPDKPRWQWIKRELEALGHEVVMPELPNTYDPNEQEQVDVALNATKFDENTILVGHSLGAVVALKVLEKLPNPIARLVVIGGFIDTNFKDEERPFEKRWNWSFDGDSIRKKVTSITVLHDPMDFAVTDEQAAALGELLLTPVTLGVSNEPHFTGDKEPDVLMWIRPTIRVFTTRADTLFGATYLVLAPEHPWVKAAVEHKTVLQNNDEVQAYVERTKKMSDLDRQTNKEKTGVKLEGVEALNPATGEKIPLYIADYVLPQYGTGAIMAVPAHDERDNEFAQKFNLPIKEVVAPIIERHTGGDSIRNDIPFVERNAAIVVVKHWSEDKYICLARKMDEFIGFVTGGIEEGEKPEESAAREVIEETGYKNPILIRSLGRIESKFYHQVKGENRLMHAHPFLFQLKDGEHEEISEHEKELHDVEWINAAEVERYINRDDMREVWKRATYPVVYVNDGAVVNSGEYDGMSTEAVRSALTEKYGRKKTTYKLRDWIVSRQRYWGVPIPMIHCKKCGYQPVPYMELPVLLPQVQDYLPDGSGKSPLAKVPEFVNATCPACGGAAERETDTLDTFVDSSWYFLRYTDPQNNTEFASREKQENWMPVDMYSGGAEHTTMHLLYSRFWHKALFDIGLVGDSEPYTARVNHGMVLGPDGQKMSKSKGNVVDPDEMVERLGADTVRMYLAFMGPYTGGASYPWNPDSVVGVRRFIERVAKAHEFVQENDVAALNVPLHKALKKVGDDIVSFKFNTAISQLMILLNAIEKEKAIGKAQFEIVVHTIAPFAPHLAEELWQVLGHESSIHKSAWPAYYETYLQEDEITIAVQLNGKMRGEARVKSAATKDEMESAARAAVSDKLLDAEIERVIVVPGRLVNFVMKI